MDRSQNYLFDLALTALVAIIWGSTYLVTTQLLPPNIPLIAAVLRALPAGLILLMFQRHLLQGHWWWRAALLGILNIGAFFYFLFLAAYHLPGGVAALILSVQPAIVLVYNIFLFRNPVVATQIMACVCAIIGIALVVLRPETVLNVTGIIAGLCGALSMATGIVLAKRFGKPDNMPLLGLTAWQLIFGGLALVPFAFVMETWPETITLKNFAGFAYLSLIGALFTYALWFRSIRHLPALTVSFISLLSPLSATVLGFIFLGQSLTIFQFVGAFLVLLSVYLAQPQVHLFYVNGFLEKLRSISTH